MSIIEDSILTAVLGDCMGIPYEFPKKLVSIDDSDSVLTAYTKRIGGRYFPTVLDCQKGTYSDDTQMLLMTLRSLQYKDFVKAMVAELKAFMAYECGSGRATRASCKSLEKGMYPWVTGEEYYNFGGNGVVMRVLPHAFQECPITEIMEYTFANGILTHGSPVALVGAQLYVYYAWCKINCVPFDIEESQCIWGRLFDENYEGFPIIKSWWSCVPNKEEYAIEWVDTVDDLIELYKETPREWAKILKEIPVTGDVKGAGSWCAIASILLAECKGIDPMSLLKITSTLRDADTDTLSCILGGLLGINGGVPTGVFSDIKDVDYIYSEIEQFQLNRGSIDVEFLSVKNLKDKMRNLSVGDSITVSPFGKVTLVQEEELESLSDSVRSLRYRFITQLGQTLTSLRYIKI